MVPRTRRQYCGKPVESERRIDHLGYAHGTSGDAYTRGRCRREHVVGRCVVTNAFATLTFENLTRYLSAEYSDRGISFQVQTPLCVATTMTFPGSSVDPERRASLLVPCPTS